MTEDPQQIAEILELLKATTVLGKHLEHAQIWEHWDEIAGPELAPNTHPMTIKKGVLHIAAGSPVWMHKFAYQKPSIINNINKLLSDNPIEDIYLTLPTHEDLKPPPEALD